MRLKSLDIKGFKSFADKTQILLDHPITGIVGPNGCGKSNIVDAIRWVIGEHKIKSLRSDNLDDLIFNGSKSRSASGMAEVSLTFENTRNLLPTEFSTVTITRKFYKSGESEYRLNDVSCRLKDIHNLFLDTGVSNDSYAIIELGMVDDIIKDKEGSRRRMLEQAAGISIYKTRKKEAKLKLDATQLDIARIEDLLFEIGNNLRTLESQARKAERYLQIKNDYKAISIELAKASLQEYNDKYQSLNNQLIVEQDKKLKIESEISGDEAEIEANKLLLVQQEQDLARAQKQFNDLIGRIRALESEKKLAAQHLSHLQDREQNLNVYLTNAEKQLKQLQESVEYSAFQINTESEALESLRGQMDGLRLALDDKRAIFDEQKGQLEIQRQEQQQLQLRQFDAEKKVAVSEASLANLQRTQFQIEEEKNNRSAEMARLAKELEEAKDRIKEKEKDLAVLQEEQSKGEKNIIALQEALEQSRNQTIETNRKLDARRNEYDLLKSLVDSLEGYPDSIKFLKKNKEWDNNAPLLSDIFSVKQEYRVALESVLDNYLNYYVVQNIGEAVQAVELLSKHKKGKANFFLLDQFTAPQNKGIPVPDGVIPALEVVETDAGYRGLAHYLLGSVFIAEDLKKVRQNDLPDNFILIESNGKMLRGKYNLSGGSTGLFEGNKIGRIKNLERLSAEIESLEQNSRALREQVTQTQNAIVSAQQMLKNQKIDECRNELNHLGNKVNNLSHRIEHFEQLNEGGEQRLNNLQDQLAEHRDSLHEAQALLSDIKEETDVMQASLQQAAAAFAQIEQDYNMAAQQYNLQNIQLTRQQSKIENLKQELSFRSGQISDIEKQIVSNKEQLRETVSKISETSGKLHFGDNELSDLLERKEKDEKSLSDRDREYYTFRNRLSDHEQKISRQRKEKEQAEGLLNSFKERLNEMRLQVAGMKERLSVEFKVDLDTILEEARNTEMNLEELVAEGDRLKKRLENMGEINPTAIEAYQEIKIRHDFILEQKNDLENARDTLLATIEEVELTANNKFRETFDRVRENFQTVFKALFTEEDKADLLLTDPENVTESGIEIYAQPKGKRPSTLTQLSGGEKTLTSTAFLFAIYLIKPAPFCILDEVDAPLDDANVEKFTQMIRKFSDNSQFIIVTHNKQTMASVDVIYGVTMQEAGVSKLVPVDFRSLN